MKEQLVFVGLGLALLLAGCGGSSTDDAGGGTGMSKAALGKMLYKDTNLSNPPGQSCESCHSLVPGLSGEGFADPDSSNTHPVSAGADGTQFGDRNAPTAAYAQFSPNFYYDNTSPVNNPNKPGYVGGQFLDGRATDLQAQAKGPFINPKEMANADEVAVIAKLRTATYAGMFKQVFGANSLDSGN